MRNYESQKLNKQRARNAEKHRKQMLLNQPGINPVKNPEMYMAQAGLNGPHSTNPEFLKPVYPGSNGNSLNTGNHQGPMYESQIIKTTP